MDFFSETLHKHLGERHKLDEVEKKMQSWFRSVDNRHKRKQEKKEKKDQKDEGLAEKRRKLMESATASTEDN